MPVNVKMAVNKDAIKAPEPVNEDLYTFRVEGFKPAKSKNGTSINYNPLLKIIQGKNTGGEFAGKRIFENLNEGAPWILNDFVHSLGLALVPVTDESGNPTEELSLPGSFIVADGKDPQDPSNWTYQGDCLGKTGECYVVKTTFEGKVSNKIKFYVCKVEDCNKKYPDITHSSNLIKS